MPWVWVRDSTPFSSRVPIPCRRTSGPITISFNSADVFCSFSRSCSGQLSLHAKPTILPLDSATNESSHAKCGLLATRSKASALRRTSSVQSAYHNGFSFSRTSFHSPTMLPASRSVRHRIFIADLAISTSLPVSCGNVHLRCSCPTLVHIEEIPHSPFSVENIQRVAETKEDIPQIFLAAQNGPPVLILARACG